MSIGCLPLDDVRILECWGPESGFFIYKGCNKLLADGRMCALGSVTQKFREGGFKSLSSQVSSSNKTPRKERDRDCHVCVDADQGIWLYHFYAKVERKGGQTVVLEVWETAGAELFGCSGQDFVGEFGARVRELPLCLLKVTHNRCSIETMGDMHGGATPRALSFSPVWYSWEMVKEELSQVNVMSSSSSGYEGLEDNRREVGEDQMLSSLFRLQTAMADFSYELDVFVAKYRKT